MWKTTPAEHWVYLALQFGISSLNTCWDCYSCTHTQHTRKEQIQRNIAAWRFHNFLWESSDQNRPNRSKKSAHAQHMAIYKATWTVNALLQIANYQTWTSQLPVFFPLVSEVYYFLKKGMLNDNSNFRVSGLGTGWVRELQASSAVFQWNFSERPPVHFLQVMIPWTGGVFWSFSTLEAS